MIPKPGKGFINPRRPFYEIDTQIVGIYSGTEEFEGKFVYTSIEKARELLRFKENQVTAIELKLENSQTSDEVAFVLRDTLGS